MLMDIKELEELRKAYKEKKTKFKNVFICIYAIIASIILLSSITKRAMYYPTGALFMESIIALFHPAIFLFVAYVIVSSFTSNKEAIAYRRAYKAYFVSSTMKKVFTDIKYSHEAKMPKALISETNMMQMGDTYASNDYLVAKYKGHSFQQADVHIQERHTDSDGDTTYTTIFRGRWVIFDLKKKINKRLLVAGKYFNCEKYDRTFKRINLESSDFNRSFNTFAQDGFEAFYVLDPAIMERIMKLGILHNNRIMICFANGKMHIAINNNVDSFEPSSINKPIDEKQEFNKVLNDIKVITNIIDEVKLVK